MIADPPLFGADHVNSICRFPGIGAMSLGALAYVRGVAVATEVYELVDEVVIVAIRKSYDEPFDRPLTVFDVVETGSAATCQSDVPEARYSTR